MMRHPSARNCDPLTSHEAADRCRVFAGTHRARILAALEHGPGTAHEIGDRCGLSYVSVDRRMVELGREGLARVVQAGGQDLTRKTPTGGSARVWEAC